MKIHNMRSEKRGGRSRVVATITWEDNDRDPMDVFFETDDEFADGLTCDPQAFLVGCVLPAMHHGEKRIAIDGKICPELIEGLVTVMQWIRHWFYDPQKKLLHLDVDASSRFVGHRTPGRSAVFFSGGIDSLAILRMNRLNFALDHPASFKDGILIWGQNIESDTRPETFEKAARELSEVAHDAGIRLVPVHTNIRALDEGGHMFTINHGAIMGAVAHAFSRRWTSVSIASSQDITGLRWLNRENLIPWGSHPLIDPYFSSYSLRIRHECLTMSRLDKVKVVADWDKALQNIKVCGPNWPGTNCGECEKCFRTMLELLALGALDRSRSFPLDDITAEIVSQKHIYNSEASYEFFYWELIPLFKKQGRFDLVTAIEEMIARSRKRDPYLGIYRKLKRIDERFLNGNLRKIKKFGYSLGSNTG